MQDQVIDSDCKLGLLEHDRVIEEWLLVNMAWLLIFIPSLKCGLNLVAFHIYS